MLLWEFEVARRLYREDSLEVSELDRLPIGVGMAVISDWIIRDQAQPLPTFLAVGAYQILGGSARDRETAIKKILEESGAKADDYENVSSHFG